MKLLISLTILLSFFLSSCVLDQPYYKDTRKCHYKRIRIYDEHGKYKGYTEERVCE